MTDANSSVWKPRATVAAVIEKDGKFLIVEEPHLGNIVFNQPAGHLEENENLIEAVIREVREETAWGFTPEFITGIYQWSNPRNNDTYMRTTFTGSVHDHNPDQPLFDGILKADWKSLTELQQNQTKLRSPMVLKCIDDYMAGERYPLTVLHDLNT